MEEPRVPTRLRRSAPGLRGRGPVIAVAVAMAIAAAAGCARAPSTPRGATVPQTAATVAPAAVTAITATKPATPGAETALLSHPPSTTPGAPAEAARHDVVESIHGVDVHDPYRWLEQGDDPQVKSWALAEDEYTRGKLGALPAHAALKDRLEALAYVEWASAPERKGKRYFFSHRDGKQEKAAYFYREGEKGEPRSYLDPNLMSADGHISVTGVSVSPDGKLAAYKASNNNADESVLHVMTVDSGKVSDVDTIPGVRYTDVSWTPASDAFYYTRLPKDPTLPTAERTAQARVYRHIVGTHYEADELVFDATGDPRTLLDAQVSRDGRFLFVSVSHGWNSTDVYFRDLSRRGTTLKPLFVGKDARFSVIAWKGKIYVRTNLGAERWRLFRIDDPRNVGKDPENPHGWKEVWPEDPEAVLDGFAVVGDHLSLHLLRRGTSEIKVVKTTGELVRTVEFPGIGSAHGLVGDPADDAAYYTFSSFLTPPTIYRTSVTRGGSEKHFAVEVPASAEPYSVEQVAFASKDGTRVPMFVIRRRDAKNDGSTPFVLSGYGGFSLSMVPKFEASFFPFLEAGGGIAIANLRGGGEYGEGWHRAGMLTQKQHVFDDFIAAAEYLLEKGYTSAARLAIRGGSNGGLLVGAAMTQRPELFRAVVSRVPLTDMVRYPLFGMARLWVTEYGSPEDPEQFRALFAYSPYHHVRDRVAYPALLVLSSDSDDRVDPAHARKFVAAVRHATASEHPVLLRVEANAGHGGADLIAKQIAAQSDEYSFLFDALGMSPAPPRPAAAAPQASGATP